MREVIKQCVIPNAYLVLCFAQNILIADLLSKDIPSWLILIMVILGFVYSIYKRRLKHKEKIENQKTTRYSKLVDSIVDIVKRNNQSKNIRSIAGKKEQIGIINKTDSEINTMQNEYLEAAIMQAMHEFKDLSFEERAPVREAKKAKRIDFPKKKKRSKLKSE